LRRRAARAIRQGRDAFALACLRRLVALDAADAACYCAMGEIHLRRREEAEALEAYLQALRLAPRDVGMHLALGRALSSQALFDEARDVFERAVRLDEGRAEAHVDLADALYALREPHAQGAGQSGEVAASALAHYERALQIDPRAAAAYRGLARVHLDRDEIDAALRAVRISLNLRPRDARACRLLVEALERHAADDPDLVGAWFSLGVALQEAGDLTAAAQAFEAAIARKADCLRAWLRLADVRLALRQPEEAVRCLDAAVAIDPEHPAAHVNLGWALRTAGDFARGWQESAWNYRAGDRRRFEQPLWDGAPLGDRTILCWADFALGDTIQDLRYLPLIRRAHPRARIVLECDRRLVSLIERNTLQPPLADVIIASKAPLPAFDCHLPLRRLPELLGIELTSIPVHVPYLALATDPRSANDPCDPRDVRKPRDTAKRLDIGIVWAGDQTRGDARMKSAALVDFAPLATLATQLTAAGTPVRIISLQLGPNVDELIVAPPGLAIERVLDAASDVADTAAIMSTLDAIITVDTMTAHLAGALGRPVWVLAAHSPAWWLWHVEGAAADVAADAAAADAAAADAAAVDADDARSRWYPTMRIIRQPRCNDWSSVLQRVCASLRLALDLPPASNL
jgi:tetratricopeptide (TPR) repeat protein